MAARVRAYDWATTPLGASTGWPQCLRTAVELLLAYAFDCLGLEVVRGSTLSHNERMRRVFEKTSFKQVGDGAILSRYDNRRYTELFYQRRRED